MRDREPWNGDLAIADGWAVWRGRVGDGAAHRHVAAQAAFSRSGVVRVETGGGETVAGACVLVEPMAVHRLVPGGELELVFVEPWIRWSRVPELASRHEELRDAVRVADASRRATASRSYWLHAGPAHAAQAEEAPGRWAADARLHIDTLIAGGRVRLPELAARLDLSGERVRHRFAQEMGLPFKRYVLWRRLRLAALRLDAGSNATEAAHEAGFADSAHLARSLKAMFGISATQMRCAHAATSTDRKGSAS